MRLPDRRVVYCAGDTNVFTDMQLIERLYHPELAFLPIGDLYTMSPREAALACRMLNVRRVIPLHFGTFPALTGRPEQLVELASRSSRHRSLDARARQTRPVVKPDARDHRAGDPAAAAVSESSHPGRRRLLPLRRRTRPDRSAASLEHALHVSRATWWICAVIRTVPMNPWILAILLAAFGDVREVPFHAGVHGVFDHRRAGDVVAGAPILRTAVCCHSSVPRGPGVRGERKLVRSRSAVSGILDGLRRAVRARGG